MDEKVGAVLVLGGGPTGLQTSLDLAEAGFRVYLAERSPSIGGNMARLDKVFPTNECAMCILGPRMSSAAGHPNIEILTYAELESLEGEAGNFEATIRKKARSVDPDKCTGCQACVEKCPTKLPSEFNAGLDVRKAIYIPFPQAVPNIATIDKANCRYYRTGKCKLCERFCQAEAVVFDQEDEVVTEKVGAVVVATGLDQVDAATKGEYGFGRYPNVVTNMQFERLLSASGPCGARCSAHLTASSPIESLGFSAWAHERRTTPARGTARPSAACRPRSTRSSPSSTTRRPRRRSSTTTCVRSVRASSVSTCRPRIDTT